MPGAILALIALTLQTDVARPPRPADDQLTAAVQAEQPSARIVSQALHESPRGGARIGCGLIEIDGHVEPFSVTAMWITPPRTVVTVTSVNGVPLPPRARPAPEPAHWEVKVTAPTRVDNDGDGDIDRTDRNLDVLKRRTAMIFCKDLRAPEGVVWSMDREPDPDPAREAEIRARADRVTELIFGPEVPPHEQR